MTSSYLDEGEGQVVIFLHGVGSAKEGWLHQRDVVVDAGFRFIAIDAPGYGETPLPEEPGFGPHSSGVIQSMDSLGIETAIICGHSLGGMTAQEIYAAAPDRVDGLILSATSPAFGRPDGDFQKQFLASRMKPFDDGMTMLEFANNFVPKLLGSSATDRAIAEVKQVLKTVPIPTYKLAMQTITQFDQRANLPNISVPVLLIAGAEDTNSPASMMAKMASKINGSNYVELEGTGHLAPVENPDGFNQHLTDFLKRLV